MSDVIETTEETYPAPDGTYVRRGRCIYCGSKKLKHLYSYDWCDKTCKIGAQVLDIYEREHHLGAYARNDAEETESE